MSRGYIKAPGVNLLVPSDPSRRIRTLGPGDAVEILDGTRWLRVSVDGVAGLVPAAAVEVEEGASGPRPAPGRGATGAGIRPFVDGTCFVGEPILAHVDFHAALRRLDAYAARVGAKLHVTRSFRRREGGTPGAPVPASQRSNHLVGHAIDADVVLPGYWLGARDLSREHLRALPAEVRYLIQQIREDGELRWGGDFVHPDPTHVDDDLYGRDPEAWMRKLHEIGGPASGTGA